jgi:hypothetical protein
MVERKLSDQASREYWKKVEEVAKEVSSLPSWMKGGPAQPSNSSASTVKSPSDGQKVKK